VASSEVLAVEVSCSDSELTVVLDDGRTVSVPLSWFPRLLAATQKQRKEWGFIGGGIGIHWEAIDEDISVASLLQPEKFMRLAGSALQPVRRRQAARNRRNTSQHSRNQIGLNEADNKMNRYSSQARRAGI
jgi:hypothetical protein